VTCGERQLTYAELNASADRVAGYLRAHGVAAGAKVGICLRPSVEWPLCVLAVVKAGAAFLVLDPADPPARHAEGIAAAGLTAVIGRDYRLPVGSAAAVRSIEIEDALAAA